MPITFNNAVRSYEHYYSRSKMKVWKFRLEQDSNPWPLWYRSNCAIKATGSWLFYEFVITNQTSVTEMIVQKTITLYLDLLMIFFDVEGNVLHLVTQYLQRRFLAKNKIQYGLFVTSQGSHKSNSWKHAHNTKHGYMQPVRMARNKSNIRNERETINLQQCWFLLWNNWGLWPKRLKWYLDLLKNP